MQQRHAAHVGECRAPEEGEGVLERQRVRPAARVANIRQGELDASKEVLRTHGAHKRKQLVREVLKVERARDGRQWRGEAAQPIELVLQIDERANIVESAAVHVGHGLRKQLTRRRAPGRVRTKHPCEDFAQLRVALERERRASARVRLLSRDWRLRGGRQEARCAGREQLLTGLNIRSTKLVHV